MTQPVTLLDDSRDAGSALGARLPPADPPAPPLHPVRQERHDQDE